MYADRYATRPVDKRSLTLSLVIVGGLVTVAAMSNTVIEAAKRPGGITTIWVTPPPPPPPPPKPQPQPRTPQPDSQATQVARPDPIVPTVPVGPLLPLTPDPLPPIGEGTGSGVTLPVDPPKPPPVLRGADVDARYARDFQPTYPAEERRAGREGVVTLRVLIGTDGRVHQVERIAAASDAFWAVTERQALGRWRFKPATRDGVAYETWKTMTVRFRLEEE